MTCLNRYDELIKKQQEELKKYPLKFAFNNEQFKEAMEDLGLKENDTEKIISIGFGGFIRKDDVKMFREISNRHINERKQAIENDKTGEEYIKDMFTSELENHEYGYTQDLEDTLNALDLSIEDINNDERLKHGLELALNEYKEIEEELEE